MHIGFIKEKLQPLDNRVFKEKLQDYDRVNLLTFDWLINCRK